MSSHEDDNEENRIDNSVLKATGAEQNGAELNISTNEQTLAETTLLRRAQEMAALYETSLEITAQLDLSTLLQAIMRRATTLLSTSMAGLFLLKPDGQTLEIVAADDQSDHYIGATLRLGEGIAGRVVQTGQPMWVADYSHWEGRVESLAGSIGRILGVPLRRGQQVIGTLNVFDDKPGLFAEDEIRLLSLFAAQAAIAIENARLFDETRQRAEQLEALRQVSQDLVALRDLEVLLHQIVKRAIHLLGGRSGGISLYRPEREVLEWVVEVGEELTPIGFTLGPGEGLGGKVWLTGQPLIVNDYQNWAGKSPQKSDFSAAVIGVPIVWGDEFLGVLTVVDNWPHYFTTEDTTLLSHFATQAAIAIQNAHSYAETQQRLKEQIVLQEVGTIISSTLELKPLLSRITEQMGRAMDVTSVYISTYEPETESSVVVAEYFSPQAHPQEQKSDLGVIYNSLKDFPRIFALSMTGRTEVIHSDDPDLSETERFHIQQYGAQTILIIPLRVGRRIIACAELWESRRRRLFTAQEIRLCEAIAQQAAIAIENARLHEETQKHAQQVQQILDTVQEGILLLDTSHSVRLANPVGQTYLARLAGVAMGQVLTQLGGVSLEEIVAAALDVGWHEVVLAGSPPIVFEVTLRPTAAGSMIEGWVMVLRDVTRERAIQARAQEQDRLAAVGQLAGGIAHDFNNILTSIIGYAELVSLDPGLSALGREDLGRIVGQGQRAAHLVRQILDFSRQSMAERRELDLASLVTEATKILERVIPENIHLVLEIEPADPGYFIKADPAQIQQTLTNLALNARDAMPMGGTLRFRLSRVSFKAGEPGISPELTSGSWVLLSISDTGIGIPPELQSRIFEPFFTTKEVGQGAGLGLAQVYGIIKQHEGQIEVESQEGQGATFRLYFPGLTSSPAKTLQPSRETLPLGQGEVILLVEDDETVLDVTKFMLEHLGYRVLTATNGREALAAFEQHQAEIALVLTDATMPEVGGVALAQALHERKATIKTVILTGYPLETEARQLLAQGIVDWVQKPLNMAQLGQVVRRVLQ